MITWRDVLIAPSDTVVLKYCSVCDAPFFFKSCIFGIRKTNTCGDSSHMSDTTRIPNHIYWHKILVLLICINHTTNMNKRSDSHNTRWDFCLEEKTCSMHSVLLKTFSGMIFLILLLFRHLQFSSSGETQQRSLTGRDIIQSCIVYSQVWAFGSFVGTTFHFFAYDCHHQSNCGKAWKSENMSDLTEPLLETKHGPTRWSESPHAAFNTRKIKQCASLPFSCVHPAVP